MRYQTIGKLWKRNDSPSPAQKKRLRRAATMTAPDHHDAQMDLDQDATIQNHHHQMCVALAKFLQDWAQNLSTWSSSELLTQD